MKTIIYKLRVVKDQEKFLFQIPLLRNARSLQGIRVVVFDTRLLLGGKRKDTGTFALASLNLWTLGEQNNFYSEDLTVKKFQYNQDSYWAINPIMFNDDLPWIGGTREDFQNLEVPLTANFLEGYFENHFPLLATDFYEVFIYLKLEL